MSKIEFIGIIKEHPKLNALYIEIPFDVEQVFGKKRVKIKAIFDKKVEYRGSIVRMNKEHPHLLGLNQEIRKVIKKNSGDEILVEIKEDKEERIVNLPEDLKDALTFNNIIEKFNKMSYTHQKEYVNWINEAKKEVTRKKRIELLLEKLQ